MAKEKQEESIEKQLWKAADKLRKNIDAAEYKHVVMGLVFLKYISDSFEELYNQLQAGEGDYAGADPEDRDEYKTENVFFVPPTARWFMKRGRTTKDILFIDARNMGALINRRTKEFSHEDADCIAQTYHNWKVTQSGTKVPPPNGTDTLVSAYEDIKGFCVSASLDKVQDLNYVLTPGRYVGLEDVEDEFDFKEKFESLQKQLKEQMEEE